MNPLGLRAVLGAESELHASARRYADEVTRTDNDNCDAHAIQALGDADARLLQSAVRYTESIKCAICNRPRGTHAWTLNGGAPAHMACALAGSVKDLENAGLRPKAAAKRGGGRA